MVEGIVPTLQNIVATVNSGCRLDLKAIVLHARNTEYNPKVCGCPLTAVHEPFSRSFTSIALSTTSFALPTRQVNFDCSHFSAQQQQQQLYASKTLPSNGLALSSRRSTRPPIPSQRGSQPPSLVFPHINFPSIPLFVPRTNGPFPANPDSSHRFPTCFLNLPTVSAFHLCECLHPAPS